MHKVHHAAGIGSQRTGADRDLGGNRVPRTVELCIQRQRAQIGHPGQARQQPVRRLAGGDGRLDPVRVQRPLQRVLPLAVEISQVKDHMALLQRAGDRPCAVSTEGGRLAGNRSADRQPADLQVADGDADRQREPAAAAAAAAAFGDREPGNIDAVRGHPIDLRFAPQQRERRKVERHPVDRDVSPARVTDFHAVRLQRRREEARQPRDAQHIAGDRRQFALDEPSARVGVGAGKKRGHQKPRQPQQRRSRPAEPFQRASHPTSERLTDADIDLERVIARTLIQRNREIQPDRPDRRVVARPDAGAHLPGAAIG